MRRWRTCASAFGARPAKTWAARWKAAISASALCLAAVSPNLTEAASLSALGAPRDDDDLPSTQIEAVLFWATGIEGNFRRNHNQIWVAGGPRSPGRLMVRSASKPCEFIYFSGSENRVFDFDTISEKFTLVYHRPYGASLRLFGQPLMCDAVRTADSFEKGKCTNEFTIDDRDSLRLQRRARALQFIQTTCPGLPAPEGWNFEPNLKPY